MNIFILYDKLIYPIRLVYYKAIYLRYITWKIEREWRVK